jgi:hypothetical protein
VRSVSYISSLGRYMCRRAAYISEMWNLGRIPALLTRMVRCISKMISLPALVFTRIRQFRSSRLSTKLILCSPLFIHTAILYSLSRVKEGIYSSRTRRKHWSAGLCHPTLCFFPEGRLTCKKKKGRKNRGRQALDHSYNIRGKYISPQFSSGLVRIIIGGHVVWGRCHLSVTGVLFW